MPKSLGDLRTEILSHFCLKSCSTLEVSPSGGERNSFGLEGIYV